MKRKKRIKALIFLLIGAACMAACAALALHNMAEDIAAGKAAMETVSRIEAVLEEREAEVAAVLEERETEVDIALEETSDEDETSTIYIDGYSYIGVLEIPSLERKLPVLASWSYSGLTIAPCRYSGSAIKKNLIIAGHNYSSHFGPIRGWKGGETVYFTTVSGCRFEYTVTEVVTIPETDVEALYDGDWDLTLFTCTADGESRVAVRCRLVEKHLINFIQTIINRF
ncbi:MAG: sortase [Lachnospiraceae bacterium]|nr:sortase [Lachnospiraceae bacterium]